MGCPRGNCHLRQQASSSLVKPLTEKLYLSSIYGTFGKSKHMGLVDKLKTASSVAVIDKLLEEGKEFAEVSPKTKRRWSQVATSRLKELSLKIEEKSSVEKKTQKPKK